MNSKSAPHNEEHLDLVFLYALESLPSNEISAVKAHLMACADCRHELETLRPIIGSFVSWPTDVLRPSTSLWERVEQRLAQETDATTVVQPPKLPAHPEWKEAAPGVSVKLLATDALKNRVSMLVRLAPGTDYPPHCHV